MSSFPTNPSVYTLTTRIAYQPGLWPGSTTLDTQPRVFVDGVPTVATSTDLKMVQQDFPLGVGGTFVLTPLSAQPWTSFRSVYVFNEDNQTPALLQLATCTINTTSTATVTSGQTLILSVNGSPLTVTFGGTLSTPAAIVAALNSTATFSTLCSAWLVNGLYISMRPLAANGTLSVTGGTALSTLGFSTANSCGPIGQPVRLEANGGSFISTFGQPVTYNSNPNPLWPGSFTVCACDSATGTPGANTYQGPLVIAGAGYL